MTPTTESKQTQAMKVASTIALLAGLWYFVSPWVYGVYAATNSWNNWIVGAVVVILAAIRLGSPMKILVWAGLGPCWRESALITS